MITKETVIAFMRDLRGTAYRDPNKADQGVMSAVLVADILGIDVNRATTLLDHAVYFRLTERQGGRYVI